MVPFANNIQRRIIGWHLFPIKRFELVPLSAHDNCMGTWTTFCIFDKLHTRVTETISNREGDITVMGTFRGGVGVGAAGDQILHLVHIIHILVGLEQQTLQSLLSRDNRQEWKTLEDFVRKFQAVSET